MQETSQKSLPPVEQQLLLNCAHHAFKNGLAEKDGAKIAKTFHLVYEAHNAKLLGKVPDSHVSLLKAAKELVGLQSKTNQFFGEAIVMLTLTVLTSLKPAA
ncbi:hypothetical protein P2G88_02990 [Aliiglaciecola sp. CAU 1673]|uniref:hypothetical protein n=1 Tax=Aliiglaciecola sp. CAU 1673 TaxID=3032595 RepID=UPI0023D9A234|nr:hypothetical protein [Aliiglaciecola sp. CAU 1673]MDF2177207.1 hypothetical protein [Aliiglaciecola sp. CAU 1673]